MRNSFCESKQRAMQMALSCLFLTLAVSAMAGTEPGGKNPIAAKGPVVVAAPEPDWGGPLFGGGVKSNDTFTEGSLFMVYPWLNTIGEGSSMAGGVGFLEPYASWGEGNEIGLSLGLGYRHLFSNQTSSEALKGGIVGPLEEGFYVGANSFYDYLMSPNESHFHQLGFGLEAGTRYVEVRANYYLPLTDEEVIGRRTETTSSSSSSTSSSGRVGATEVSGGRFVQPGSRSTTTRTSTTTQTRTFETFEEALEGVDIELAVLMPFIDQYCDMQLIGGYYEYTGDRSRQPALAGWRAGVEIRPVPALVLHATWYEDDRLYQDDWMVGFRVELPLGGSWKKAFTPRRRHLAERLFEPVSRKNANITTNGTEEEQTSSSTTTTDQSSTKTVNISNDLGPVPTPRPRPTPEPAPVSAPPVDENEETEGGGNRDRGGGEA